MSNLHGREPLSSDEVQECLESLVAYQDQFYGKILKVELEVQYGPFAPNARAMEKEVERLVADGNDRVRWQSNSNLADPFGPVRGEAKILKDYAFDGSRGTVVLKALNGKPFQGSVFCEKSGAPRGHTGDWLLLSVGFHPCDFTVSQGRTIPEALASLENVFRLKHPKFGDVICFEEEVPAGGLVLPGGTKQWYLREQPEMHFIGLAERIPVSNPDQQRRALYEVTISYEEQGGYWLPRTWEFYSADEFSRGDEKRTEVGTRKRCVVKRLEWLNDVPAEVFQIDIPADVRVVDDCNPPKPAPPAEQRGSVL